MAFVGYMNSSYTYDWSTNPTNAEANTYPVPVRTGQEFWIVHVAADEVQQTGATMELFLSGDFTILDWLKTPATMPTPGDPIQWEAGPAPASGDTINLGTSYLDTDSGLYVHILILRVHATAPGEVSSSVTFQSDQSDPTVSGTSVDVLRRASNPNLGLPFACQPGTVGWEPDYSAGKLVFNDQDDYTIPNRAVRFTGSGPFELHVATLEGDDVTVVAGTIPYPRVERKRTARIACQMFFGVQPDGTPHDSVQQGLMDNWAEITALSDLTVTETQGLQSITYTPYVGADDITFDAHVLPPIVGDVNNGIGMSFGFILEVPDPTDLP